MIQEKFTSVTLHFSKYERWLNLGRRLAPMLLYALCVSSIFCFFILYSPNPFETKTKHDLYQNSLLGRPQKGDESCDLFKGHWIPSPNGSLYTNYSCPTIPDSKNCFKNGREDEDFLKWRWKPDRCQLPRFDPKTFLGIVRGKTMAFIGDSVARNQMESLLCLLSKEEIPVDVYKDSEDRFRTWHFPRNEFTLQTLWSRFLVNDDEMVINGSKSGGGFSLHLDEVQQGWTQRLPSIDIAVVSAGHWFFRKLYLYERGEMVGCVYCNEPNITARSPDFALRVSLRNAIGFINQCKDCKGITTLVRTFSPAHFEHGTWNNGGSCNKTSPQDEMENGYGENYLEFRNAQLEEIERAKQSSVRNKRGMRFEVLDVTRAMLMRPDGHPGSYWGNKWMKGYNDCVHWCLPGPIDTWNEFLMAVLSNPKEMNYQLG